MPDFQELYNPDLGQSPNQVQDPQLNKINVPFTGMPSGGYNPDLGINHVDAALGNLGRSLHGSTVNDELNPLPYDAQATNAERYQKSDYFGQLGFNPFRDNEENYGLRQTLGNKLKNAFSGAWDLIKNQFVEQATSWGDTLDFFKNNKSAFEQSDFDEINKQQQDLYNRNPIFETQAQKDGVWNWNTLASTIQQSGYALGAIAEITAEELAMSALTALTFGATGEAQVARTAQLATKMGNVLRKTEQLGETLNSTSRLRKVFEGFQKVNPFIDNTLEFATNFKNISRMDKIAYDGSKLANLRTAARGFGAVYRDAREFNVAIAEAKAEAASSYKDMKDLLTQQYQNTYHKDPIGDDANRIENAATQASQTNGVANTYLIMLSNKIGMGNVMGGFKPLRALEQSAERGIIEVGEKTALKTGAKFLDASSNKWMAFKQGLLRTPLSYLKTNLDEALQENLQDVSHDAIQSYYAAKYGSKDGQPLQDMTDYIRDAATKQFNVQGAKTFISGFLTGAIIAPINSAFGNAGNIKQKVFDKSGYQQRQAEVKSQRTELITAANNIYNNPLQFNYKQGNATLQANFSEILKNAAATDDKKAFFDIKDDALRHLILTGIRTGSLDTFTKRLQSYTKNLTPEEFTKAFGLEYTEKNAKSIENQVENFTTRAEEIKDLHENLSDNLKNPFEPFRFKSADRVLTNPEFVREAIGHTAWNEAVDNLVFTKDYYNSTIRRQKSILSGMVSQAKLGDTNFNDVYLLTNPTHLNSEISNLKKELETLNNPGIDATTKVLKGVRSRRLEHLTKYKEHLDTWNEAYDKANAMPIGEDRTKALDETYTKFIKSALPIFGEYLNNEESNRQTPHGISNDNLKEGFSYLHDYLELQKESGNILDKVNLLSDPKNFSLFYKEHNRLATEAYNAATTLQEAQRKANEPKKTITVITKDETGKDISTIFTEGESWVGPLSKDTKYRKNNKTTTQFNNDRIKIDSISDDGKIIKLHVNDDAPVDMDAEEVAQLAKTQKWVKFNSLSDIQKAYLGLRNKIIKYRVVAKDSKGRTIKGSDGKYVTQIVEGRVALNKTKDGIQFKYLDPHTKKEVTIDYNTKFVVSKQDILSLPDAQQHALAEQQKRLQQNFKNQVQIFEGFYNDIESKLTEQKKLADANKSEFEKAQKDIEDMQAHLDLVIGELERNPYSRGRKSNYRKELEDMKETLSKDIGEKQSYLERLKTEKESIEDIINKMKLASDLYSQAYFELQDTDTPFDREGRTNIYDNTQDVLDTARKEQVNKRHTDQQIVSMLDDTEAERDLLNDRIRVVEKFIESANKSLAIVSQFRDIVEALEDITDKQQLRTHLKNMLRQEISRDAMYALNRIIRGLDQGEKGIEVQALLQAVDQLKRYREELVDLKKQSTEINDKYNRLSQALNDRGWINSLQERVDFLKQVQDALTSGYQQMVANNTFVKAQKIIKAKTAKKAKEMEDLGDLMASEPVVPIPPDDQPFYTDVAHPRLDQVGLFKSAFRHYWRDTDTQPVSPEAARFFKFTEQMSGGEYYLQPVTANNDKYGIRKPDEFADDIKAIVLKKVGNEYKEVGVDGEILDNPTRDNIIYTSLHGNDQLLGDSEDDAIKWIEENFATKGMTREQILSALQEYKAFREDVKEQIGKGRVPYLQIMSKSQGVQAKEPLDIHTGRPQELPLEGRLIQPKNNTWASLKHPDGQEIRLEVSTTGSVLNKKMKSGRVAMVRADNSVIQVYNRQLGEKEKTLIIETLKVLAPLMGRRYLDQERLDQIKALFEAGSISSERAQELSNPLTELEQDTFDKAINYLMGTLYWKPPKEGVQNRHHQFFIAKGMLHKTVGEKVVGEDGKSTYIYKEETVPFNAEEIEKSKDQILEGVYHQVNNKKVEDKANAFYEPAIEDSHAMFTKDGKVVGKKWSNYTQYLLDGSDDRQTPIYTNIKPADTTPGNTNAQLRSIYLTYGYAKETQAKPAAQPVQAAQPTKTTTSKGPLIIYSDPMQIPDGADAVLVAKRGNGIEYYIRVKMVDGHFKVESIKDENGEDLASFKEASEKDINSKYNDIIESLNFPEITPGYKQVFSTRYIRIETYNGQGEVKRSNEGTVIPAQTPTGEAISNSDTSTQGESEVEEAKIEEQASPSEDEIERLVREALESDDDDPTAPFRLALEEDPRIKEDVTKFTEWMKERLPEIPVEKVQHLINGRGWGRFINGAIQIFEGAGEGTGYHEAFEAVWGTYLTDSEQSQLESEFKAREGSFTNPFTKETKLHKDASPYDVREMLAEEFSSYIKSPQANIREAAPKRNGFFRRLLDFIKKILGLRIAEPEQFSTLTDKIFRKINDGGYIAAIPNASEFIFNEGAYRAFPGYTVEFTQKTLEGMAAIFFSRLYENGRNVESLFGKGENTKLFTDLYEATKASIKEYMIDAPAKRIVRALANRGVQEADIKKQVAKYLTNPETIAKQDIVSKFDGVVKTEFKKFLGQFGLEFKDKIITEGNSEDREELENQVIDKENTVKDTLGILESIYVDPRNMTKSSVRLLIASLTADEYKEGSSQMKVKKNSLGLPTLEDYGRKLNILLNELHSIVRVKKNGQWIEVLDQMFEKLDNKFKSSDGLYKDGFQWLSSLKSRLKYEINGQKVDMSTLNDDELRLLVGFEASFSNNKNLPVKLLVGEDGYLTHVDPIVVTNIAKIKERWQNEIKTDARTLRHGESFATAPILYISAEGQIVFNTQSDHLNKLLSASTPQTKIDTLRKLGIQFTYTDAQILNNPESVREIAEAFNGIYYAFKQGLISSFDDLFGKQVVNGPITKLLGIEMGATSEDNSLSHQNAEKRQQYSITEPSAISNVLNSLKGVDTLKDFIDTNPQYGSIGDKGEIYLNPYLGNSNLFKLGGIVFDEQGKKKRDIDYQYILGVSLLSDIEGSNTDSLKYPDKIVQEIYHLLNGTYYTVINSDKSSEFGISMGHFISWQDIKLPVDANQSIMDAYQNALLDEIRTAVYEYNSPSNIQYYSDTTKAYGATALGHFRDILKFSADKSKISSLQKEFISRVLKEKETPEDFVDREQVKSFIREYLKEQVDKQKKFLLSLDLLKLVSDGVYSTNAFSREQLQSLGISDPEKISTNDFTNLVKFMAINRQLGVFEQHKLLYGHPALYKDLAKRSNGINSQKQVITDNRNVLSLMDRTMPRLDGKIRDRDEHSTMRFVSYNDPVVLSRFNKELAQGMYDSVLKDVPQAVAEKIVGVKANAQGEIIEVTGGEGTFMDPYINADEPDGQAYIMLDFFRDLMYLSGKFSKEQEALWNYEKAIEIVDRSNPDSPYYRSYPADMIESARNLLATQSKPKSVFQVLKPQGFGYQMTEGVTHTTFLKHSVMPLTWSRVKDNPSMAKMYVKHQANKIDMIGFGSGEKVGNILQNGGFVDLYTDKGEFNDADLPIQSLLTKYYGIQVEMPSKIKEKVVLGTQMRKLILSNLPEELKSTAEAYIKTLEELMQLDKRALIKELGLSKLVDGSYQTSNLKKLVNTLREEAISKNLPDNVIDMINTVSTEAGDKLQYKFDANPIRENIDNILNAIVDSRVISQKMFGKASVQVAATMWEKNPRQYMFLRNNIWTTMEGAEDMTAVERKTIRMHSSDLKFYTKEEPWMEVYLPYYLRDKLPASLKMSDIDPELLKAIGFRIPTQGMNSIENIRIKDFLDPSYGDMVVVPTEMVGKSGSDFDIDKLNLFLPNFREESGKAIYIDPNTTDMEIRRMYESKKGIDETISTFINKLFGATGEEATENEDANTFFDKYKKKVLQNRLIQQMSTIVSHPDNYRQLVVPNGSATLQALAEEIRKLKGQEKEGSSLTKLSEWDTMVQTRERYITGKQLVGIGALQITSHTMSQIGDVELTGTFDTGRKDRDGNPIIEDIKIKFNHNSKEGKFYLSAIKDKDNQWISELLSEALTGFVDAAKNPFVFDLNLNLQTAATWFYLQKLGVPVRELAYLHTQPLVEAYFKEQARNESLINKANDDELERPMVIFKAADEYIKTAFGYNFSLYQLGLPDADGKWSKSKRNSFYKMRDLILKQVSAYRSTVEKYGIQELRDNIAKQNKPDYRLTKEDALQQLGILFDYLDYQTQAGYLSNFINSLSYDTARTKNIIENRIQQSTLAQAYTDKFVTNDSLDRVFDRTFLGEVKEQKEDIFRMFKDYFVTLHPNAQEAFEPLLKKINNPYITLTKDKKAEILNRYQNFFIASLLHTIKFREDGVDISLNQYYHLFFSGKERNSLAQQLKMYRDDARYKDNKALKNLFPLINTNRSSTDNIKLFNNKLSTYEVNTISESLMNLKEQAVSENNQELLNFVKRIGVFASLQSGVQLSPITFTRILPIDVYSDRVGKILDKFTDEEYKGDPLMIWKEFHQNNWYNSTIVPRVKKFGADGTGIISVSGNHSQSKSDYISTRTLKPEYTGKVNPAREEMVKLKKFDEIFEYKLYERIHVSTPEGIDITDEQPTVFFRPVNRKGRKMYMTESYNDSRPSVLPENEPFDESQYDEAASEIQPDKPEPKDSIDMQEGECPK